MPRRLSAALVALFATTLLIAPAASASPARLAWFYKPPTDGSSAASVAGATTGQLILTKRDESFKDQLRSAGYQRPILQYVEAAYAHGPAGVLRAGAPCDASFAPWGNNVAWNQGDFCRHLHPNEDWFLHNGRGERLTHGYYTGSHGVFYAMNPASAGWRQFYASRVRQALFGDASTAALGYQGIFLDDVWMTRHQLLNRADNADGVVRELSSDAAFRTAVIGLLRTVKGAAAGRPVHANTDGNDVYLPYLDGTMREDFAGSWNGAYMDASTIRALWASADRAAGAGKSILLVSQGARQDTARMRFSYAAYLMVAGPSVSFRYTRDSAAYRELWLYPEYGVDLGAPQGGRSLVGGATWRRQFGNGVALVNLSAGASQTVELGGVYAGADGSLVSSLVLPPRTGAILQRIGGGEPISGTAPPRISGKPTEGSTLSATTGGWSVAPRSVAYAWLRCNSAGGSCKAIAKATGKSYRLVRADAGSTVRVRVTATAGGTSATAVSAATAVIASRGGRTLAAARAARAAAARKAAAKAKPAPKP